MSGEFRRVATRRLWADGRMRTLRRDRPRAHDLFVYLVTSPSSDFTGLWPFTEAHARADLLWSRRVLRESLQALVALDLVAYDAEAEVIYVPALLAWQPIKTAAQAVGAVRRLSSLPQTALIDRLRQDALASAVIEANEATRPLLEYLGLTPGQTSGMTRGVTPPQGDGQAVTPVQVPLPVQQQGPVSTAHGTRNAHIAARGDQNVVPRTPGEMLWEEKILPLTGQQHRRDAWLKALSDSGARDRAQQAIERTEAALAKGGVHNTAAFLWSTFQELSRRA